MNEQNGVMMSLHAAVSSLLRVSDKPRYIGHPSLVIEHMEVDLVFSRLHDTPHLRILDIGAHHGEFLDIFEHHNHPHTYEVICVEPMPENVAVLRRRLGRYRRIHATVCPVAISDVSAPRTFYQGSADTLFTCTESWKETFPDYFTQSREVTVECLTLADLAQRYHLDLKTPFDFVKIDTEGHDLHVLQALVTAQVQAFAIMFEVGPDLADAVSAIELLQGQGFEEFYEFGRKGIATLYIGPYEGGAHLYELRRQGRLDAGNVVAFRQGPRGGVGFAGR